MRLFRSRSAGVEQTAAGSHAATLPGSITLVCKSAVFQGNIRSEADVRIEGVLEGDVEIKGTLYIAPEGRVVAQKVVCGTADVSGEISGSLTANEMLLIRKGGVVLGDISVANLVIEQGGFFGGTSHDRIKPEVKQAEKPTVKPESKTGIPGKEGTRQELPGTAPY